MVNKENNLRDKVKSVSEKVKNKFNNNNENSIKTKKENKKESKKDNEINNNNEKEKSNNKKISPEERIKELEKLVIELKTDKLRTLADFENYRKRKDNEVIEARDRAIVNFVIDLLPAIDNFEMSLKMTDNKDMFIKGVEMIHKNLIDTLKEHKIEEFEVEEGEEFNPIRHDPVLIEDENSDEGKVLGIIKKGYIHKDKVIRPARVKVKVKKNN